MALRGTGPRWRGRLGWPSVCLAVGLWSGPSWAQSAEEVSGARAVASEGLKAYEGGRYVEAIDYFSRAESLVHAPPHLLYMARAHVALGHLVEARELYIRLRNEELPRAKPKVFHDAKRSAELELAELEPELPYVKVVVEGPAATDTRVTVTMDGAKVPTALVGVARPVDPGRHEFTAAAEGLTARSQMVEVARGAHQTVVLSLTPASEARAGAVLSTAPVPTASMAPSAPTPGAPRPNRASVSQDSGLWPWVSLAVGAVGAVGLGVGIVETAVYSSARGEADALCPDGVCAASRRAEIESHDRDANRAAAISTVGFVVGGLGLAGAVTLWLLQQQETPRPGASALHGQGPEQARGQRHGAAAQPWLRPWIGWGAAGFGGVF